jgi:flagella basal body P-ring formation protein FlgA
MRALLVLAALAPALIGSESVRIALRPHVEVGGPIATLGDIAEISGEEDLVARLSALTLLELPGLGEHHLTAAQVRSAVSAAAPGRAMAISGDCLVSRRALVVRAEDLVAAAVAVAASDSTCETEATRVRDGGAVIVPDDMVAIRVVADALDNRASGDIPYRVRVMRGETELGRSLVTLAVMRFRTVIVAARAIRMGEVIATGDLRSARMAVDSVNRYALSQGDGLVGESARIDIAEGTPLVSGLLRPHLDIHGGGMVTLIYSGAGIAVTGSGEALSDGKIGDMVSVRRSNDGQCIKGRVIAPGEVRVNY